MKDKLFSLTKNFKLHPSDFKLLLWWIAIGTLLRFARLDAKSPWTDEFSTMVFSLGNSFRMVPLEQPISIDVLLQPLVRSPKQISALAQVQNAIERLLDESNHPPIYFALANLWMQLFPTAPGEYVSLWVARSLPALLGVASIPAMFLLGKIAFRSRSVAHLAAALIAVSPYGIYLSQEARHYTLATLLVIASLCCLAVTVQAIVQRQPLSKKIALIWIIINSLGIAVHYFFVFTLCAEALALIELLWQQKKTQTEKFFSLFSSHLKTIFIVALGTMMAGLVWVPVWLGSADSRLTEWIYSDERTGFAWLSPIFQAIGGWIPMLYLLPVESPSLPVVIISGLAMLIFFIWAMPILWSGLRAQLNSLENQENTKFFVVFVIVAIAIFFGITYLAGIDLTRAARYNFVYFPGVIVLLAASLAVTWNQYFFSQNNKQHPPAKISKISGKKAVILIWLMGLLSGLTVVSNLGYQKYYRPDLLVPIIHKTSLFQNSAQMPNPPAKVLIATTHKTHVQIGEMMGIAWEFRRLYPQANLIADIKFFLAHQENAYCQKNNCSAGKSLEKAVAKLRQPTDVWLVNFHAPVNLEAQNCFSVKKLNGASGVNGYNYQVYRCWL
ncbi:MAG: glycosyltransferase [Oscillatoriaceae bacterium SKW80]|nr:glycosyltransferase [Oscillatoriaceae bacterium SKYG93]MCX8121589.1 glycosyltransferase [Oscillatoriaceae bacterium SKW80]MDW8452824.1 glycosyltransferase [Oscillatoriaceae cyanobacterium SKYGB_i_bin93]HIK27934.1 glycosyltransferase [Oscillatoriaceae cyanobacterium M7585_C2015_266]